MTNLISVLLHWNLDYAEFPRSEADNIVKLSYVPMVKELMSSSLGPVLMNITGHTLQYLEINHQELIDDLKELVNSGKIELVGSAFSHPMLPLIPKWRRLEQLKSHKKYVEEQFGTSPIGIWPPELAISPMVIDDIIQTGYKWVAVDHEHLDLSQTYHNSLDPFSKREPTITETLIQAYWAKWWQIPRRYFRAFRVARKWMNKLTQPLLTVRNLGRPIRLFQTSVAWTNSTIFALQHTPPFFTKKNLTKLVKQSDLHILPLYASDIEFFGYRSHTGNAPTPQQFVSYLKELQDEEIELSSPSNHPDIFENSDIGITAGSWAPDKSLRIWTDSEDNRELTRRITEVYRKLETNPSYLQMEEVIRQLRIAENSDARGWSPITERKIEAFGAISKLEGML